MKKLLLFVMLLLPLFLSAQTSTLTATITDSDAQTWNNGTFTITFVPIQGVGGYQWNGATLDAAHQTFTGTMNGSGVMTKAIPDSSAISPSGTQWRFTLCSNTSAPCSNVTTAVTGSTPDLSSTLSAGVIAPRISASFGAHAYLDLEMVTPVVTGATYYNVTSTSTLVWNGTAWVPFTAGTISGTLNFLAKFTSTTNVGNANCFDNGTDPTRCTHGLNTTTIGPSNEPGSNANPGTTLNKMACVDGSQHMFTCGTGVTKGSAGVAIASAGNSGTPVICTGLCSPIYDNQTAIGDVSINSNSVAGDLHDVGSASCPGTAVDCFIVDSVNGGAATTALTEILTPRNFSAASTSIGGKLPVTIAKVTNNWLDSYTSGTGMFTQSRPSCASLSDSGTGCTSSVSHSYQYTFPSVVTAQTWAMLASANATFPANFSGSAVHCGTPPGGTTVFTLTDVTTSTTLGTVSVASSGTGTFATTGGTSQTVTQNDFTTFVSGTDASAVNCAFNLVTQ